LKLSRQMGDVVLYANPLLTDLTALQPVTAISDLVLFDSALENLDAFAGVRRVANLTLEQNGRLTDARALLGLQALQSLTLTGNAQLATLGLSVYLSGLQQLRISRTSLTRLSGLDHFTTLDYVSVVENAELGALSLLGLESLPSLELIRNSNLQQLGLGNARVRDLVVVSNANLAPSQVEAVAGNALQSKVAGNQGQATGLAPCPFENDGYCDAEPNTLCALGTDLADCSNQR